MGLKPRRAPAAIETIAGGEPAVAAAPDPRPTPRGSGPLALDAHVATLAGYLERVLRAVPLESAATLALIEIDRHWSVAEIQLFCGDDVCPVAIDRRGPDRPVGLSHLDAVTAPLLAAHGVSLGAAAEPCAELPGLLVSFPLVVELERMFARLGRECAAFAGCELELSGWSRSNLNWGRADMLRQRVVGRLGAIAPEGAFALAEACYQSAATRRWFLDQLGVRAPTYQLDQLARDLADRAADAVSDGARERAPVQTVRLWRRPGELLPHLVHVELSDGDAFTRILARPAAALPPHVDLLDEQDFLLPELCRARGLDPGALSWSGGVAGQFLGAALREAAWHLERELRDGPTLTAVALRVFASVDHEDSGAESFASARPELRARLAGVDPGAREAFARLMYGDAERSRALAG